MRWRRFGKSRIEKMNLFRKPLSQKEWQARFGPMVNEILGSWTCVPDSEKISSLL
jgi:hypothetical protein